MHLTLRCEAAAGAAPDSGRLLSSTRAGLGGRGVPLRSPLGEGCCLLRGVELALGAFRLGERSLLRLPAHFAFAHPTAEPRGLRPPRGLSVLTPLLAEVELLAWGGARCVRAPPHGALVVKHLPLLAEGRGLETPHAPYELVVTAEARLPAVWREGAAGCLEQPQPPFLPSRALRLTLGAGQAPAALEAALSSMRAGERARVWTADEGCGPFSALPELPAATPDGVEWTLTLSEVVQVRDLHGDGSLLKRRLAEGRGTFPVDCPLHDPSVVRARIAVFVGEGGERRALGEPAEAEWQLGLRCQPPGLEAALRLMVPGERALVSAEARHAYGAQPAGRWAAPPGLPPDCPRLQWELTLLSFTPPLNWHAASVGEALAEAERGKACGLALFAEGAWGAARDVFAQLASKLAGLRGLEEAEEERCVALRTALLLNAAACSQRLGEHAAAAASCSAVLDRLDAACAKALYRRAVSRTALGLWDEARADLAAAREAGAGEDDCGRALARLKAAERAAKQEARSALGGFLAR